ncbi:phosphoribosyltransferase [Thalassoporum mexicanum PCC 7367]|uniref:ComF family protein n=1 Tax=Thalassoporum mexicanum TaxID=3457544 RepID=UPI00029FD43B|nr:ComF family protein [Pseudanabaena sp. PCC 7367]AFY71749.1 phosphoribosyltransferase [Pseudanabaena sp. PCC 7367]
MRSPHPSQIWRGLLDLFLQPNCPLCGRSARNIVCIDCDRQIEACRYPASRHSHELNQVPLFAWGQYDRQLKRAITICKFNQQPNIARFLGEKMAQAQELVPKSIIANPRLNIVPIPLHPQKLRMRGFNQAELIASRFGDRTGLRVLPHLLKRIKNTKPQFETKSRQEREENLNNAFMVDRKFQSLYSQTNFSVLLLDDIYTSGATIRSAIAALNKAKIKVAGVVVLSKTSY